MGRQHSVMNGHFREAKVDLPLSGDEVGERSVASRPIAVFRLSRAERRIAEDSGRSCRQVVRRSYASRRLKPTLKNRARLENRKLLDRGALSGKQRLSFLRSFHTSTRSMTARVWMR